MYFWLEFAEIIVEMFAEMSWLPFLLGVIFFLALYIIEGYAIMCIGHKAKIDGDFMPFIPIARQLLKISTFF